MSFRNLFEFKENTCSYKYGTIIHFSETRFLRNLNLNSLSLSSVAFGQREIEDIFSNKKLRTLQLNCQDISNEGISVFFSNINQLFNISLRILHCHNIHSLFQILYTSNNIRTLELSHITLLHFFFPPKSLRCAKITTKPFETLDIDVVSKLNKCVILTLDTQYIDIYFLCNFIETSDVSNLTLKITLIDITQIYELIRCVARCDKVKYLNLDVKSYGDYIFIAAHDICSRSKNLIKLVVNDHSMVFEKNIKFGKYSIGVSKKIVDLIY